jgi:hypothetical protein
MRGDSLFPCDVNPNFGEAVALLPLHLPLHIFVSQRPQLPRRPAGLTSNLASCPPTRNSNKLIHSQFVPGAVFGCWKVGDQNRKPGRELKRPAPRPRRSPDSCDLRRLITGLNNTALFSALMICANGQTTLRKSQRRTSNRTPIPNGEKKRGGGDEGGRVEEAN